LTFTFKKSTITEIQQHQVNIAGIRPAQILATKLVAFRPFGQNCRPAGFPPEYPNQNGRPDLAKTAGFQRFWQILGSMPESSSFGRNLVTFAGIRPT
jgi:hypothetical protein